MYTARWNNRSITRSLPSVACVTRWAAAALISPRRSVHDAEPNLHYARRTIFWKLIGPEVVRGLFESTYGR